MNIEKAIKVHNKWRRGDIGGSSQVHSKTLGEAIDRVVNEFVKESGETEEPPDICTFVCELNTCYEECEIMQPAADCRLCEHLVRKS